MLVFVLVTIQIVLDLPSFVQEPFKIVTVLIEGNYAQTYRPPQSCDKNAPSLTITGALQFPHLFPSPSSRLPWTAALIGSIEAGPEAEVQGLQQPQSSATIPDLNFNPSAAVQTCYLLQRPQALGISMIFSLIQCSPEFATHCLPSHSFFLLRQFRVAWDLISWRGFGACSCATSGACGKDVKMGLALTWCLEPLKALQEEHIVAAREKPCKNGACSYVTSWGSRNYATAHPILAQFLVAPENPLLTF